MDNTYWNNKGTYQAIAEKLQAMVPTEGAVLQPRKNKALERFRNATNCYYDLYNNGLCNRKAQFARVFEIPPSRYAQPWARYRSYSEALYERTEAKMDIIVMAAAIEQGLVHDLAMLEMQTVSF